MITLKSQYCMRKLLISILLVSIFIGAHAQSKKINIIGDWHIGDEYHFAVNKTVNKNNESTSMDYKMHFLVVDSTENGYRIKMTYDQLFNNPLISDSLLKYIDTTGLNLTKTQTVYYLTDANGTFLEIENWEEVWKQSFDFAYKILMSIGEDTSDMANALRLTEEIYMNQEGVSERLCPEISFLQRYIGFEIPLKPVKSKTAFNTPFGNVGGTTTLSVTEFNPETQYCRIENRTQINDKELTKYLKSFAKAIGVNSSEVTKEIKKIKFEIVDKSVFEYIAYPGIPLRVEYTRGNSITYDQSERKENTTSYTIRLLEE